MALAGAMALAMALAGTWAVALALALTGAWAVAVAMTVAGAVAGAGAWVEKKLKSFSPSHTFLILVGTSCLGLGLGSLGYWAFKAVVGH